MTDCDHQKSNCKKKKILRWIFTGLLISGFTILVVVPIIRAILQPKKPQFILQDATVYAFNVSASNFLTSTIQVTIASHNPNDKIGVYYDKLFVYTTYHNQQTTTYYTAIPPTYQRHKDVNVWSPFVSGTNVPVAPYNGVGLCQDQANGAVNLCFKIEGRVRWKVGSFISGRYHIFVKCPASITFGSRSTGVIVGNAVKYQINQSCSVSVSSTRRCTT